jgi:phosphoserine aminotransferase
MLYDFFENHPDFKLFVKKAALRSRTVIVAQCKRSASLRKRLEAQGLIVGDGYGKMAGKHIRVANFPAIGLADVQKLLEAIGND